MQFFKKYSIYMTLYLRMKNTMKNSEYIIIWQRQIQQMFTLLLLSFSNYIFNLIRTYLIETYKETNY